MEAGVAIRRGRRSARHSVYQSSLNPSPFGHFGKRLRGALFPNGRFPRRACGDGIRSRLPGGSPDANQS